MKKILFASVLLLAACGKESIQESVGRAGNLPSFLGGKLAGRQVQDIKRDYPCPEKSQEKRDHGTMKERIMQKSCYGI